MWDRLSECGKPVVIYGMGNGADKIADRLLSKGIEVSDFFASDGFVRGQSFRGKTVLSFNDIKEKYKDFVILVAFATRLREVLDVIYELDEKYELYAPDVPVAGEEIFDASFFEAHAEEIERVRQILADHESLRLFNSVIEYQLSGRVEFLRRALSRREDVISSLLRAGEYTAVCDAGAYDGDTVREFMEEFKNVRRIIALEPDPKNYRKLVSFSEANGMGKVEPYNCGAWNKDCIVPFDAAGNRNSRVFAGGKGTAAMRSIDGIFSGGRVDYIKYDVEGSEYEALQGSSKTIRMYSPDLCVSVYHRSSDIFRLPLYIHELEPEYRLYMRRFEYVPAWDLNIYACKK